MGPHRVIDETHIVHLQLNFSAQIGEQKNAFLYPKAYLQIYRTIILPIVLYGCETWSLTLREERKLRVFENMVLRRIFGLRRDEVTEELGEIA